MYGRYHHAGDEGVPRDDNFQGYGVSITSADGRYAFKTIRPVPYSGRPAHLHIRVRPASGPALTTQIYIAGDAVAGDPVLAGSPKGTLALLVDAARSGQPARNPTRSQGLSISCCVSVGARPRRRAVRDARCASQWIVALERNRNCAPERRR